MRGRVLPIHHLVFPPSLARACSQDLVCFVSLLIQSMAKPRKGIPVFRSISVLNTPLPRTSNPSPLRMCPSPTSIYTTRRTRFPDAQVRSRYSHYRLRSLQAIGQLLLSASIKSRWTGKRLTCSASSRATATSCPAPPPGRRARAPGRAPRRAASAPPRSWAAAARSADPPCARPQRC